MSMDRMLGRRDVLRGTVAIGTGLAAAGWAVPGLAQTLPEGRLLEMQRCAHVPFLSHPATFTGSVIDFLEGA